MAQGEVNFAARINEVMSTRACFYIQKSEEFFLGAYFHYDGYPSGLGRWLYEEEMCGGVCEFLDRALSYQDEECALQCFSMEQVERRTLNSDVEWCYVKMLDGHWKVARCSWVVCRGTETGFERTFEWKNKSLLDLIQEEKPKYRFKRKDRRIKVAEVVELIDRVQNGMERSIYNEREHAVLDFIRDNASRLVEG